MRVRRSGSADSLASNVSSFMSAFSDVTAYNLKSTQEDWTRIQTLCIEKKEILPKIEAEIITMNDASRMS